MTKHIKPTKTISAFTSYLILFLMLSCPELLASKCKDSCKSVKGVARKTQLVCEYSCEKNDPRTIEYCPEFLPCEIACEEKFPEEQIKTESENNEKIKCNGICFSKYFKIDCQQAPKMDSRANLGTGVGSNAQSFTNGGDADGALRNAKTDLAIQKTKNSGVIKGSTPPIAAPGGITGSASSMQAETLQPNTGVATAEVRAESITAVDSSTNSVATEVAKAMLSEVPELSLFQRVTQKYREKHELKFM